MTEGAETVCVRYDIAGRKQYNCEEICSTTDD